MERGNGFVAPVGDEYGTPMRRSMGRRWGRGVRLLWGRGMRPLWGRGVGPLLEREYKTTVGEGVWNPCCGRVCDACGEGYKNI